MRSRTIREGSVGIFILFGIAVFVGLVLWLGNVTLGKRSYKFIVNFANVAGMKVGAQVRYRGVQVGRISELKAATNGVDVTVEITPADLLIPRDALVEANQAGLIGETAIDITPLKTLSSTAQANNPLSPKCNPEVIICNNTRLNGSIGVSFDELLRSTIRLSNVYSDPAFFNNVNTLTKNASVAATGLAQLSGELSLLSRSARQELGSFSATAQSVTGATTQTLDRVGSAASRFGNTADEFSNTARQLSGTVQQAGLTAAQLGQLAASANDLVAANKSSLSATLSNFRQASDQLRLSVGALTPLLNQAGKGDLLRNLETISTNAAQASANAAQLTANLRDISTSFNNPNNIVLLQQTLDSARATFENTQKITSDLDELTGDPAFRSNLKQLVNGLGKLVSSTEQLQQQVQVAQQLEPLNAAINQTAASAADKASSDRPFKPDVEQTPPATQPTPEKPSQQLFPPASEKPSPEVTPQPVTDSEGKSESE